MTSETSDEYFAAENALLRARIQHIKSGIDAVQDVHHPMIWTRLLMEIRELVKSP